MAVMGTETVDEPPIPSNLVEDLYGAVVWLLEPGDDPAKWQRLRHAARAIGKFKEQQTENRVATEPK